MHDQTIFLKAHPGVRVFLLSVLLFFAVVLGLGTYAAAKLKEPFKEEASAKIVQIPVGTSSSRVAAILDEQDIIRGEQLFLYYLWAKGAREKIQAGSYELSASLTIPEIVERLTRGQVVPNEVRIRIGEGWTLSRIAAQAEESNLGTREEFAKLAGTTPANGNRPASAEIKNRYSFLRGLPAGATLEGYLFPDTYLISRSGGVEELVHKALQNFERKVVQSGLAGSQNLHSVITIASLVEAEVGRNVTGRKLTEQEIAEIEQERFMVADVFWSRLQIGMALESDATVGYATGKPRRQAAIEDTKLNLPYNTYRFAGLPPGPVSNPSLASIKAALNPADTNYLFFLSAPDGKAYFAHTLEEHGQNRARYLK